MRLLPEVRVATGLYTNWDTFVKVNSKVLGWVRSSKTRKPSGVILDSVEEAAYTLVEAFREGGREYLISEGLHSQLYKLVKKAERRVGGNGYHMGRALYDLGLNPLVSYPCRPPSLMKSSPDFKVACEGGFKKPREAVRVKDPEYDHVIFELKEDPRVGIYVTGRHILSWDLMSFQGMFDEDFLAYASNRKLTDVLIFAYAHLLLPSCKERTDEVVDNLSSSGRPRVHLELGQGSLESVRYAMETFADRQCADSWGLNEKECVCYLGAESEKLEDLKVASLNAAQKYGLERICIHTPTFVFSVSRLDAEREAEALRRGCLAASAMTLGGVRKNLKKAGSLPTSGIQAKVEKIGAYNFCLFSTYVNMKPKVLTGLGDAFSAVQATIALS